MDILRGAVACLCVAFFATSRPAAAESQHGEAAPSLTTSRIHVVGAGALLRSLDGKDLGYGGQLEYRLRFPSEVQLGLTGALLALEADRIGGFATKDTRRLEATALGVVPLGRTGPLGLDLRAALGYAELNIDRARLAEDRGRRLGLELAVIGNVILAPRLSLRLGFATPFAFELAPARELATQGALLLAGLGAALTDSLFLRTDMETGGLFGFDGDGTKYETRASVSLRWVSGHHARSSHAM